VYLFGHSEASKRRQNRAFRSVGGSAEAWVSETDAIGSANI